MPEIFLPLWFLRQWDIHPAGWVNRQWSVGWKPNEYVWKRQKVALLWGGTEGKRMAWRFVEWLIDAIVCLKSILMRFYKKIYQNLYYRDTWKELFPAVFTGWSDFKKSCHARKQGVSGRLCDSFLTPGVAPGKWGNGGKWHRWGPRHFLGGSDQDLFLGENFSRRADPLGGGLSTPGPLLGQKMWPKGRN